MSYLLSAAAAPVGSGIITADPTAAIVWSWLASAAVLGGLVAYAVVEARKTRGD